MGVYRANGEAKENGPGWFRVSPAVMTRLAGFSVPGWERKGSHEVKFNGDSQLMTTRLEYERSSCRGYGASCVFYASRRGEDWLTGCQCDNFTNKIQEAEWLNALGAAHWVKLKEMCFIE